MSPQEDEDQLNRTLVAGLILEVMLDDLGLPADPRARRSQVKNRLKAVLASRLAGRLPLSAFRSLTRRLDDWFECFYPVVATGGPRAGGSPSEEEAAAPASSPFQEDLLEASLGEVESCLPKRRHRKIDRLRLSTFIRRTGGHWFRLRDFEAHFAVDRKTAWEYVQKFIQAGLFIHNQGRAAAARYRLAPRFLKG
jgi:hypothetical protein